MLFRSSEQPVDLVTESEIEFLKYYNPDRTSVKGHYQRYQEEINSLHEKGILDLDRGWGIYMTIPYLEDLRQNPVWRDKKAFNLIKEGLCKYISEICTNSVDDNVSSYNVLYALSMAKQRGDYVQIYSFNYTSLPHPYGINLKDITHHVHGTCSDRKIIIGTEDSPILNNDYDFLQKSFDPNYNPPSLVYDLLSAQEIVIFGHSIRVNDRQYFKSFFQKQTSTSSPSRKKITIFTRDEKSEIEIKRSLQQMTDHYLSTLYGLNDLQIIKTANIKDDPSELKAFMQEHIKDDRYVIPAISQLTEKVL